jgi:hypothetical protein
LVFSVVVAANTYSLYRAWQRGEIKDWDDCGERRVTLFDVLISAAFCLAALAAGVYECLHPR